MLDEDGAAAACPVCRRVLHPQPIPLPESLNGMAPARTAMPPELVGRHDLDPDDDEAPF